MAAMIAAPELVGSREEALELLSGLPLNLSDQMVVVSFDLNRSTRPSFVDELVKEILVVRCAKELNLRGVSETVHHYAQRSATSRQVDRRLTFS